MATSTLDACIASQTMNPAAKQSINAPYAKHPSSASRVSEYSTPATSTRTSSPPHLHGIPPAPSEQTRLQMLWEERMDHPTKGVCKDKTAVLLLSWEKDYDDLNTSPEVDKLAHVFKTVYGYTVVAKKLGKHGMLAQVQMNQILANFVAEEDSQNTLLIIYYAGHGFAKDGGPGKLNLAGKLAVEAAAIDDRNQIIWDVAENNLRLTQADVFAIFDCCYAGRLCHAGADGLGRERRTFEFLAACSADGTTCKPGPKSFTSALVWSLGEFDKQRRHFHSYDLLKMIRQAPDFPEDQFPPLVPRLESHLGHVIFAPSSASRTPASAASTEDQEVPNTMAEDWLDIRLYYDHRLTDEHVASVADALKSAKSRMKDPPLRIALRGKLPLLQVVDHWLQRTRKRPDRYAPTVALLSPDGQHLSVQDTCRGPCLTSFGSTPWTLWALWTRCCHPFHQFASGVPRLLPLLLLFLLPPLLLSIPGNGLISAIYSLYDKWKVGQLAQEMKGVR